MSFQLRSSARLRLQTFRFCSVKDLGRSLAVCKNWYVDANAEPTWAAIYESTQLVVEGNEQTSDDGRPVKNLINRPFGEDAVGWRVAVTLEGHATSDGDSLGYTCGCIKAYDSETDKYCVLYDAVDGEPAEEVWEIEHTRDVFKIQRNPAAAGESRFQFFLPPSQESSSSTTSTDGVRSLHGSMMRFNLWKEELRYNVQNTPSHLSCCLDVHEDEVLCVVFSPCGRRLACCSRDCSTSVWCLEADCLDPSFELKAHFEHETPSVRALWWPTPPHDILIVTTEDADYTGFNSLAKIEIWEPFYDDGEGNFGRRVFRHKNHPFDIHTALIHWPPWEPTSTCDPNSLSFITGRSVSYHSNHAIQLLDVWSGPRDNVVPQKLASLRARCGLNYLHALQHCPGEEGNRVAALTGSTPHLCDQFAILHLSQLKSSEDDNLYDIPLTTTLFKGRHISSAKWSAQGEFVILNTRPHANLKNDSSPASSYEKVLERIVPDLSTSMEILVLDSNTLDECARFDGHYAFTTKECPFTIYTDEWGDTDFLASGGEDGDICVWHRRHHRLLRRLRHHTASVNMISWNGDGLLASASDDHTVGIWSVARGVQSH